MWIGHQAGILFFLGVLVVIVAGNWRAWRRLGALPPCSPAAWPRVSILLPARNEEHNIGSCLASLLAQDYPDFEVIVLDDRSTDGTAGVLSRFAHDGRLRVMQGEPLPSGWLGKHWACHQLAQAATGDLLLLTDADTRHHPRSLRDGVAALLQDQADLVTALPRQRVVTWLERLLVPIIPWGMFVILPLGLAHRVRLPTLSAAIGQYMLFRREAYLAVGGHASVRANSADDLALARRIKAAGRRWRLVDGVDRIECRMYRDGREVWSGLTRTLYGAFGYRALPMLFAWGWMSIVFVEPVVLLGLSLAGRLPAGASPALAAASVILALAIWGAVYARFRLSLYLCGLYPLSVLLAAVVAVRSLWLALMGRGGWKGRSMVAPTVRWF